MKQGAKIEPKVLVFPGDPRDPNKKQLQICLTGHTLGKGQFGIVQFGYEKEDINRVFAVKVIDRKKLTNQRAMQNLMNEIALMSEIKAENVVSLRDATKTANNYYLAMELLNGGDLDNLVKARGGFLKENEARFVLRQIVSGLGAIKDKQIMHRDLKLPNVMINFSDLRHDVCINPNFDLKKYIQNFNFET